MKGYGPMMTPHPPKIKDFGIVSPAVDAFTAA